MTCPMRGFAWQRDSAIPQIPLGDLVSDGTDYSVLAPQGMEGLSGSARNTNMAADKVLCDSCGLISNPHQPLHSAGRSE